MTVRSDQRKIIYQGNGTTTQFAVPFYFINNTDIQASVNDGTTTTDLVLGTDYTLTGAGVETGGTLTTSVPVAQGSEIAILRTVAYKQEMDIPENDIFPSQNMERALDRLTMQTQQLNEQMGRAVTVDVFSDITPDELVAEVEDLWAIKDDITTVAGISSEVSDVSANKSNINAAVANATNINAAVSNATNINAVAGNATNINAAVANESNINTAVSNMAAIIDAPNQASAAAASATLAQDWAVKMDGQVESTDYSSKYYAGQAATSATAAQEALEDVHGLIATPIGTIFQSVYVDESMDIARQLNGQLISSTKFTGFRDWLDTVQAAIPNLFTDEATWQAEKLLSKFGQVGKFVIDDVAHTIRLPAVVNAQGLLGLSGIGNLVNESLPNITGTFYATNRYVPNDAINATGPFTYNGIGADTSGTYVYNESVAKFSSIIFNANLANSTYQDDAPVQQEAIQYPYYIQVATGIEETLPAIREYKVNNSDYFGKSMYSDVTPDNASWLASNGSYNARSVYPDYYDWLVSHIGETITANGGKVVLSTGTITDYDFVVNQNDQTFRLPLLNGEENTPSMLRYIDVPLPASGQLTQPAPANGYYTILGYAPTGSVPSQTNPMYVTLIAGEKNQRAVGTTANALGVTVAACKDMTCYVEYSNFSITSQSYGMFRFYYNKGNGTLYYYVGDTVQDASLINAGAVLGQLANKADIDASNFNAGGKSLLSGLGATNPTRFDAVTLLASGQPYIAPANGYFTISARVATSNTYVGFYGGCYIGNYADANNYVRVTTPLIKKGNSVRLEYTGAITVQSFAFFYANGEG